MAHDLDARRPPAAIDLVAVDVGNSSTQIGVFASEMLVASWRISSSLRRTADELRHLVRAFAAEAGVDLGGGSGVAGARRSVVCSVVPTLTTSFAEALRGLCGRAPLVVDGRLDLGIRNLYADPSAVGPDRLANAVAAAALHGLPAIIVDLGTATTFDVVSAAGDYLGGAIAPGIHTSADALFQRAARLPRVELEPPPRAIGRTTGESIQSGIILGAAILIDGLVARIAAELGAAPRVIATGGDAGLVRDLVHRVDVFDPHLTLHGLRLIERRLRPHPAPGGERESVRET